MGLLSEIWEKLETQSNTQVDAAKVAFREAIDHIDHELDAIKQTLQEHATHLSLALQAAHVHIEADQAVVVPPQAETTDTAEAQVSGAPIAVIEVSPDAGNTEAAPATSATEPAAAASTEATATAPTGDAPAVDVQATPMPAEAVAATDDTAQVATQGVAQ